MIRALATACTLMVAGLIGGTAQAENASAAAQPFSFALVGDYPYFPRDDAGFPYLIEDLRRATDLAWILHLGDLHNPKATPCSEALFTERRDAFLAAGRPFVITPGDNDWADCDGAGYEWLIPFRRVFFGDPSRILADTGIEPRIQGGRDGVRENLMWVRDGVVFATLHMIAGASPPQRWIDASRHERDALREAGTAWMEEAFRVAEAENARGVFLATQISLWPLTANPAAMNVFDPGALEPPYLFDSFLESLVDRTRAFGRPVVLANGDTHTFRIDKPLFDEHLEVLQNFTRVEGFGSPHGHWVRVLVEPDREEVFSFRQEWVTENLYTLVPRDERNDDYEDYSIGRMIYAVRVVQWTPTALAFLGALVVVRAGARWALGLLRRRRDVVP